MKHPVSEFGDWADPDTITLTLSMNNYKDKFSSRYKIIIRLLVGIFLFDNCTSSLDIAADSNDSLLVLQEIQPKIYVLDEKKSEELVQQIELGFNDLPVEILIDIFSYIKKQHALLRIGCVCKSWREAVEIVWKKTPLDLSRKSLSQKDCKALAYGPFYTLILAWVNLEEKGIRTLALSSKLEHLNLLNIRNTKVRGVKATKAITSGNLTSLTTLNFGYNYIKNRGVKVLASGNLIALTTLSLELNGIADKGAKALASGNLTALTKLNLSNNLICSEGAKAIACGNLTNLTKLNLSNNPVCSEGAKAIACGNLTALKKLNLKNTRIEYEGAKALASGNLTALTKLNLSSNSIRSEGAKALACGNLTALKKLNLQYCSVKSEGKKALRKNTCFKVTYD